MRRIGLIGGTSWLSTVEYYRLINEMVNERLGGSEFAALSLDSLNYGDLVRNNNAGQQDANEELVVRAAERLVAAGAEAIVICANTPHMFAPAVEAATGKPLIHIAVATAAAVRAAGLTRVGLIGTKLTMELPFYSSILQEAGVETLTPGEEDKEFLHRTIFSELGRGEFTDQLREEYLAIIDRLKQKGAEGVILGCTEIPLLLAGNATPIPAFDTTRIHSSAAVDFVLAGKEP